MSCKLKTFYDRTLLSKDALPIDSLVARVREGVRSESKIWKGLYDVTPDLVDAYAKEARQHLRAIKANLSVYGYLYFVAEHSAQWHTVPHFDYIHFPLMKDRVCVLNRIRKLALEESTPDTSQFDATCLYALYFYALMINPTLNWIMVDYLANGNRYHQFGTRLKGKMKMITKKVWL